MRRVLRFEFETASQLRFSATFLWFALAVGVAGFIILLLVRSIAVRPHALANSEAGLLPRTCT